MDRYNPLQKSFIKIFSKRIAVESNFFKTIYKYFRYAAQSRIFSN